MSFSKLKSITGSLSTTPITREEYFELIRTTRRKLEYYDGMVVDNDGPWVSPNLEADWGTWIYSRLSLNVFMAIAPRLENTAWRVLLGDAKVEPYAGGELVGISLSITKWPLEVNDLGALRNPTLVCELVSSSDTLREGERKLKLLQQNTSLRYILLLNRDKLQVQLYTSIGGSWHTQTFNRADSYLLFAELGIELEIKDLYGDLINEAPFNHEGSV